MSTRIYVCGHRPFTPPPDPAYQALHVGKNGGPSLGFPGDDTGDNISWKNYRYGELTGMWWIWKNSDFNGNVGLCHYRRYFINPEQYPFTEAEFDQILSSYDCITPQVMEVDPAFASYRDYYNDAHDPAQLPLLCQAMQEVDPEGLPVLEETLSERLFYYGNLCVFHRSEFDAYVADIEGMGLEMLLGAERVIRANRPVLCLCIYHNKDELFGIYQTLKDWNLDYHFMARMLVMPITFGELTLIAWPGELSK